MAIAIGAEAPAVEGASQTGPHGLFFYKVTCPTCQMAAEPVGRFEEAYPGRVAGVGQDPEDELDAFSATYGLTFASRSDLPPYEASNKYGIERRGDRCDGASTHRTVAVEREDASDQAGSVAAR